MSADLIARGKDLIDGITDEPWVTVVDEGDPYDVPIAAGDGQYISRCPDCGVRGGFSEPDAEFIAAARTLVPEFVDEVEKLRGAIKSISDIAIGIGRPFHRMLDDILAITSGIEAK